MKLIQFFLQVVSVNLKMDQMTGRSRGFAFVVFQDVDTLSKVLAEEHAIKGKKVAVKKAASKQGKIYVGKFKDASISEDQIREYFSQYGQVVEIQRPVDRSKNRYSTVKQFLKKIKKMINKLGILKNSWKYLFFFVNDG